MNDFPMCAVRWLPVPGYEGLYEVSDAGGMRSLERRDSNGRLRCAKALACSVDPTTGYRYARLSKNGGGAKVYVHLIVLRTFKGEPSSRQHQCCHGDGNRCNVALDNLRWDTPQANWLDKFAHGTATVGEKGNKAVLREEEVQWIRESGQSSTSLAAVFGVTRQAIGAIRSGKNWRYLPDIREGARS